MYTDWDFGGTNWPWFEDSIYTSPPTSLCARMSGSLQRSGWASLKTHPCLPELTIVHNCWYHYDDHAELFYWVRAQENPVPPYRYPDHAYVLRLYPQLARLFMKDGLNSYNIAGHAFSPYLPLETWIKFRFALWDWPTHAAPTKIAYRFELWETDHWTIYFEGTSDHSKWSSSAVNKTGLFLIHGNYDELGSAVDDSEFYVPSP